MRMRPDIGVARDAGGNFTGPMWSKKTNGPTMRRFAGQHAADLEAAEAATALRMTSSST